MTERTGQSYGGAKIDLVAFHGCKTPVAIHSGGNGMQTSKFLNPKRSISAFPPENTQPRTVRDIYIHQNNVEEAITS